MALALCLAATGARAAESGPATAGEDVLACLERDQGELRSLEASFVEVKSGPLYLEPERASGRFYYAAPDRTLWQYTAPPRSLLVRGREVTLWYPDEKRAERFELDRRAGRLLEVLGGGASPQRLRSTFDLRVAVPADPAAPYRLALVPRLERLARRLAGVELEIDRDLCLPVVVRYEEAGGTRTELRLEQLRPGAEIAPERFELELPPGTEVREGEGAASPFG